MAQYGDQERQEDERKQGQDVQGVHNQVEGEVDNELYKVLSPDEMVQSVVLQSQYDLRSFEEEHRQIFEPSRLGNPYVFKDMNEINLVDNKDDKDEVDLKLVGGAPGVNGDESGDMDEEKINAMVSVLDHGDYNNQIENHREEEQGDWKPVLEDCDNDVVGIVGVGNIPLPKEDDKKLLSKESFLRELKDKVELREHILIDQAVYRDMGLREQEIQHITRQRLRVDRLYCTTCGDKLGDGLKRAARGGDDAAPPKSYEFKPGVFDITSVREGTDWHVFIGLHEKSDWVGIADDMAVFVCESLKVSSIYEESGSDYLVWGDIENYNAKAAYKSHYDKVWPGVNGYTRMYRQGMLMLEMVNRGEMDPNQLDESESVLFDDLFINCEEIWPGKKDYGMLFVIYLYFNF